MFTTGSTKILKNFFQMILLCLKFRFVNEISSLISKSWLHLLLKQFWRFSRSYQMISNTIRASLNGMYGHLGEVHQVSFAQWQYRKRWGLSELRLLLIENYTQYPAMRTWNTVHIGNFWRILRFPRNLQSNPKSIYLICLREFDDKRVTEYIWYSVTLQTLQKLTSWNICIVIYINNGLLQVFRQCLWFNFLLFQWEKRYLQRSWTNLRKKKQGRAACRSSK